MGFYCRFIKNYNKIIVPLTEYLKGVWPIRELKLSVKVIYVFKDLK